MSELGELSADAKSLVELGRNSDGPSASDRQRVKSRLAAELGAAAFVVAAAATTTLPAALPAAGAGASALTAPWVALRGLWTHGLVKAAAAASAVGALYLGALTLAPSTPRSQAHPPKLAGRTSAAHEQLAVPPESSTRSASGAEQSATSTPTPTPPAAAGPAEAQALLPAPRAHAARARASAAQRSSEAAADDARVGPAPSTLGAELALLASAQRALREHQPQRALELAQQHAARFVSGSLGEERRGIEALAHCQLGEPGHATVANFLAQAPSSPLAARVRKECAPR